jgi:hypothetical protein
VKAAPYPAPRGCVEPALGAVATRALGTSLSAELAAHLRLCAACRLQQAAFVDRVPSARPAASVRAHVLAAAHERGGGR